MPYKDKPVSKLYYSISEVAEMLQVKASQIRFWEKEFDTLKPAKNSKGNRQYTQADINALKAIHSLVKEKGYRLSGAKKAIKGEVKEVSKNEKTKQALLQLKHDLLKLAESIN